VLWNITNVTATQVWPTGNKGTGVKVAILDTGIDYRHPDLAPNYAGGYNFIARNNNPLDDHGHGTHVAGIIAAAADGAGVEGVAPAARLYACKVLNSSGSGSYSNIIAALQWCVDNKMQIASMSLGATTNSKALHDACTAAYQAGVLLVAAAGNSGAPGGFTNTVEYPAVFGAVMAIAAVDSANVRPWWSSSGPKVELAAPGVNISSDKLGGGLVTMSGTSMACPHVSGVAALVYGSGVSKAPWVRQRLVATATDLGAAGRDPLYGWGLVNAQKATTATTVASR
jgi:subtilisin family serine protease